MDTEIIYPDQLSYSSDAWLEPCLAQFTSFQTTGTRNKIANHQTQLMFSNLNLSNLITGGFGNGENISFWIDAWVSSQPLKDQYPSFFLNKSQKNRLVSECFDRQHHSQIWKWKIYIMSHLESVELADLLNLFSQVSLSDNKDDWIWLGRSVMEIHGDLLCLGTLGACKKVIFGEEIYFEDVGVGDEVKSEGGLSTVGGGPVKKGRTGDGVLVVGPQPPRCQVEGCNLDLSDAKTYYSRHKVCGVHSKTAKVMVNGLEQRFCQQCSRFHQLPEFDQGKRSCRRRLAGHNERRRKPTSGTLLSARYGSLPSSIFENRGNSGGFLMNFSSCSRERVQWPNPRSPPTGTTKLPPLPWQSNLDSPPPYINPNVPPGPFNGVQDSNCALSLLSNHSSASRDPTLTVEYYPDHHAGTVTDTGAHMVQPSSGTMVQGQGHFLAGWGYDTDEAHLGLGQISHSGGFSGWFDVEGTKELQDAGKGGLVQVQGKISAVLGTVLICAYLFITLFPDQAEKILALVPSS